MDTFISAARTTLADLVAFDTTSHRSNLDLIAYAEARLAARGARMIRIPDATGAKANLFASIGPQEPRGVVLSGHTDVVPADAAAWTSDPFTLAARDGRLYGRGTADMKAFVALALTAVDEFADAPLTRPIHLALSYDEEVGCLGAPSMITRMGDSLPGGEVVIVGEPTDMTVISAHKGVTILDVALIGAEGHSSAPHQGACAVTHMIPLLQVMRELEAQMRAAAPADSPFDPPAGTLTVGVVHGGSAANILAAKAGFTSQIRPAPWDDVDAIIARVRAEAETVQAAMRQGAPNASVRVTVRASAPPLAPDPMSEAEELARALTGDNTPRAASYAAEAGQFQNAGYSAVLCGPGSINQAHQPDEYISEAQFALGARFMVDLGARLGA